MIRQNHISSQRKRIRNRRGTAPLEFVLALPLYVLLFLFLYLVAGATLFRMEAIQRTRMGTWEKLPSTVPSQQLTLDRPVLDGKYENQTKIPYRLGGIVGVDTDASSSTTSIAGTWDYRTVPFQTKMPDYHGHVEPVNHIAGSWRQASSTGWIFQNTSAQMRRLQATVAGW